MYVFNGLCISIQLYGKQTKIQNLLKMQVLMQTVLRASTAYKKWETKAIVK